MSKTQLRGFDIMLGIFKHNQYVAESDSGYA